MEAPLRAALLKHVAFTARPGVHLPQLGSASPIWSPKGAQVEAKRGPRGPSGVQRVPKRPQVRPQKRPEGSKLSPKGVQKAPSGAPKASKRLQVGSKRRPKPVQVRVQREKAHIARIIEKPKFFI